MPSYCWLIVATTAVSIALVTGAAETKPTAISAIVTDESEALLQNALVDLTCIENAKERTLANAKSGMDGRFRLEAMLRGNCSIKVTAVGFASTTINLKNSETRAEVSLGTIRLKISCSGPGVVCDEVTPAKAPSGTKK